MFSSLKCSCTILLSVWFIAVNNKDWKLYGCFFFWYCFFKGNGGGWHNKGHPQGVFIKVPDCFSKTSLLMTISCKLRITHYTLCWNPWNDGGNVTLVRRGCRRFYRMSLCDRCSFLLCPPFFVNFHSDGSCRLYCRATTLQPVSRKPRERWLDGLSSCLTGCPVTAGL